VNNEFIEVTIRSDSTESTGAPTRKGSIRIDQIATYVDLQEFYGETGIRTKITLLEPDDRLGDDGDDRAVLRSVRTLLVEESYARIKALIRGNVD
jgi:hypothetical protein